MGGCRCSYRDCSVRSDGKTHMFHFPVFDKIRCHQWIVNAQRTEFLNLKLSQLKNRVVCQHHFKDDMFMNETKGRLKPEALPTEDGPHCATENRELPKTEKGLTINIDDIDNEFLCYNEKKAHMGVKYGDFLTNDVDIKDLHNHVSRTVIVNNFDKYDAKIADNIHSILQKSNTKKNTNRLLLITPSNNVSSYKSKLRPKSEPLSKELEEFLKPSINKNETIAMEFNTDSIKKPDQNKAVALPTEKTVKSTPNRKIRILSHKKITGPVKIEGKLEPVSASSIIDIHKKRINNVQTNIMPDGGILVEVPPMENITLEPPLQNTFELKQSELANQPILYNNLQTNNNENIFQTFNLENELQNNMEKELLPVLEPITSAPIVTTSQTNVTKVTELEKPTNKSLLKTKLPPEKQAQIEEKRKYNMKVTDILDSCFKKYDEESINVNISELLESKQKVKGSPQTPTTSSKTPKRNSFAYIEEQLQKMERNLLSKIEENTQRIVQLKHTVKPDVKKRTMSTQTKEISEETHKKQLYVEISKFLTPEANSLIFEELFINQLMEPSQKKRKES